LSEPLDPHAPRFDVVVVGGGAAGAAAAFHLAQAGRSVVVLEQKPFPRSKPCGGGMAASVQRLFPFDLGPAVDSVIEEVRFSWCLEDPVTACLQGDAPFWIVRRSVLDAYLMEQAKGAGATFVDGITVHSAVREDSHWLVQSETGSYRSRALVIADGSGSQLAAQLGLGPAKPRFASTVSVDLEGPVAEQQTAFFEFGLVRHGFCWAFPRKGGYSIGVGTFIGREAADSDAVLSQLLPSLGFAADAGERRSGQLRIWDGHHALHGSGPTDGALAVGDAASLCDPFLAEGLRPALLSGCRAAEALVQWLDGDTKALAEYSNRMRIEWGDSMAWGKRIAQVFYRLPRVGYQLGVKRPTAPQRIAQILSGDMGYGDIAQRVIKRLLFQRKR
jgi:geranylgeranyl reductase family protein